jgi:hypothetical protein
MGGWTKEEAVALTFSGVEAAFCRCRELRLSDVEYVAMDGLGHPQIVVPIPNAVD